MESEGRGAFVIGLVALIVALLILAYVMDKEGNE